MSTNGDERGGPTRVDAAARKPRRGPEGPSPQNGQDDECACKSATVSSEAVDVNKKIVRAVEASALLRASALRGPDAPLRSAEQEKISSSAASTPIRRPADDAGSSETSSSIQTCRAALNRRGSRQLRAASLALPAVDDDRQRGAPPGDPRLLAVGASSRSAWALLSDASRTFPWAANPRASYYPIHSTPSANRESSITSPRRTLSNDRYPLSCRPPNPPDAAFVVENAAKQFFMASFACRAGVPRACPTRLRSI